MMGWTVLNKFDFCIVLGVDSLRLEKTFKIDFNS